MDAECLLYDEANKIYTEALEQGERMTYKRAIEQIKKVMLEENECGDYYCHACACQDSLEGAIADIINKTKLPFTKETT